MKENLTIRIDSDLKFKASALFKSLGLDLSTATGLFYQQALKTHGIPFKIAVNNEPNTLTYQAMQDAENGNCIGPFDSVEDLMKELNA